MRGIEGALRVLEQVGKGRFASEALRQIGEKMTPADLSLASSLAYIVLRRREMWRALYERFLNSDNGRKGRGRPEKENAGRAASLPPIVHDCLLRSICDTYVSNYVLSYSTL